MKTITLKNKVVVSDPCYELDTWCAGTLNNVLPGEYICDIAKKHNKWGNRVSHLYAIHSDYNNIKLNDINEAQDFEVGVDSGIAGIFDYDYYALNHLGKSDYWYKQHICNAFYPNWRYEGIDIIHTHNKGVASNSGFGDGSYTCFVKRNEEGQIIAIMIEYISDDEDEE